MVMTMWESLYIKDNPYMFLTGSLCFRRILTWSTCLSCRNLFISLFQSDDDDLCFFCLKVSLSYWIIFYRKLTRAQLPRGATVLKQVNMEIYFASKTWRSRYVKWYTKTDNRYRLFYKFHLQSCRYTSMQFSIFLWNTRHWILMLF